MPSAGFTPNSMETVKLFDVADTPYLKGVSVAQAHEVLAICNDGNERPTQFQAKELVERLLDYYGHQTFRSPGAAAAFAAAVSALVMEVSLNAARRAFHPLTGLPRREEFLSVAKVAKALEAEQARYFRIAANARWVIDQAEAAERQAREDAEVEASKGSAEQRAARVAELMASLKIRTTHAA